MTTVNDLPKLKIGISKCVLIIGLFVSPVISLAATSTCQVKGKDTHSTSVVDSTNSKFSSFVKSFFPSTTKFDTLAYPNIAKFLGWVDDDTQPSNLCHGYYLEPDIIKQHPNPPSFDKAPTKVTATKPGFFSQYGVSTLTGNVTITQPGRQVNADVATFYREANTGEISSGTLLGNVNLREYGKIIVANKGFWDACSQSFTLSNGVYRVVTPSPTGTVNAWGRARRIVRDAQGVLKFNNATYTTCAPNTNTWRIWGNKITLNKKTGRGSITHAVVFFHKVPVFYAPYFNFPIDKERKSGFLYSSVGFSSNSGLDFSLPYYFNLAPNYDILITPRLLTNRGLLGEGLARYLTSSSHGELEVRYIPHDKKFTDFQKDSFNKYASSSLSAYSLSRLENANDNRGFVSYKNETIFNEHWSSNININYVTDDYFFQDFGGSPANEEDQLLNQVDVEYSGENWNFAALAQAFQTIHPVNQSPTSLEQYRRLPQIDFNGDIPNNAYGLDYQLQSEFVNFDYDHTRDTATGFLKPIGSRIYITPGVQLPLRWTGGYTTPQLQLDTTLYSLRNNVVNSGETKNNITRALPVFSIDNGITFVRNTNIFGKGYTQTLEPRIFYLFVPTHNQTDVPVFDSSLSTFGFDQLFSTNRFSGHDLVGDANQISVGLTTRFLDANSAEEKFRASVGQTYAFHRHNVCIKDPDTMEVHCDDDPLTQHDISPVVGEVQYDWTPHWSATASSAWDPNDQKITSGAISVRYQNGVNRIFNLGYNFIKHGDFVTGDRSDNLNRINLSLAWPINDHWNVVGDWNYNVSHNHSQEYFYGLEYQSCCWAIRVVQDESFVGTDANNHDTFNHGVYVQFLLKGLGSTGSGSAGDILTAQIPGYQDNFKVQM